MTRFVVRFHESVTYNFLTHLTTLYPQTTATIPLVQFRDQQILSHHLWGLFKKQDLTSMTSNAP